MRSDNRCNRNLKRNYKENQEEEYFYLQVKGSQKALKEDIGGLFQMPKNLERNLVG